MRREEGGRIVRCVDDEHFVWEVERVDHFQEGFGVLAPLLPGNDDLY